MAIKRDYQGVGPQKKWGGRGGGRGPKDRPTGFALDLGPSATEWSVVNAISELLKQAGPGSKKGTPKANLSSRDARFFQRVLETKGQAVQEAAEEAAVRATGAARKVKGTLNPAVRKMIRSLLGWSPVVAEDIFIGAGQNPAQLSEYQSQIKKTLPLLGKKKIGELQKLLAAVIGSGPRMSGGGSEGAVTPWTPKEGQPEASEAGARAAEIAETPGMKRFRAGLAKAQASIEAKQGTARAGRERRLTKAEEEFAAGEAALKMGKGPAMAAKKVKKPAKGGVPVGIPGRDILLPTASRGGGNLAALMAMLGGGGGEADILNRFSLPESSFVSGPLERGQIGTLKEMFGRFSSGRRFPVPAVRGGGGIGPLMAMLAGGGAGGGQKGEQQQEAVFHDPFPFG